MKQCIKSITDNNIRSSYEIIVIDNASTDGITQWLLEQPDIKLRCNSSNSGFAAGCNQGIEMAKADNDVMLLNNDTVVMPNSLFWLRMGLYERATVGAAGAVTNCAGNCQMVLPHDTPLDSCVRLAQQINVPIQHPYENKTWLVGYAMLIKRSAMNIAGYLDTGYGFGNYEDNDYGLKLTSCGYELLLCYNSFIYHYGSLGMKQKSNEFNLSIDRNRQRCADKWKMNVDFYSCIRTDLIDRLDSDRNAPINVLEIECGFGSTLSRIRYVYPYARTCGIEYDAHVAEMGQYMADIIAGNALDIKLPYEPAYFDYIILSNIGRYGNQLDELIARLNPYIKPTGQYIF